MHLNALDANQTTHASGFQPLPLLATAVPAEAVPQAAAVRAGSAEGDDAYQTGGLIEES